jgi:transcriptional regulator with XRE-family HTH domain
MCYNISVNIKEIGRYVKLARKDLSLTQQELADALRVSRSTISDIERGHDRDYGIGLILSICKQLNIDFKIHYTPLSEDDLLILQHYQKGEL